MLQSRSLVFHAEILMLSRYRLLTTQFFWQRFAFVRHEHTFRIDPIVTLPWFNSLLEVVEARLHSINMSSIPGWSTLLIPSLDNFLTQTTVALLFLQVLRLFLTLGQLNRIILPALIAFLKICPYISHLT